MQIKGSRSATRNALLLLLLALGIIATKQAIAQFHPIMAARDAKNYDFLCSETAHSRSHWDYGSNIHLILNHDTLSYATSEHSGSATRDKTFYSDRQVRFADPSGLISDSDDVGNIYLDNELFKGESGELVLSGANIDSHGAAHLVWETVGAFHCEPALTL